MNDIALNPGWARWLDANWADLAAGAKVQVPPHLSHPHYAGFNRETFATPEGQVADWVLPASDGSRVHVHEFVDGRLVAHRDRFDPNRSLGHLVVHVMAETALVPILLLVVLVVAVGRSARA